jgi:hypothetical protein
VHGNANEEEARRFLEILHATLKPKKLFESAVPVLRVVQLAEGGDYILKFPGLNPDETNCCVHNVYQIGEVSIENS